MSESTTPMRHLIWKDERSIRALVIAILVSVVVMNLFALLYFVTERPNDGSVEGLTSAIAILLPNLFALGVGPTLVGTEKETGTFDWLRTLPVSWHKIVTSKLLVAFTGLLGIGLLSTSIFGLQMFLWNHLADLNMDVPSRQQVAFLVASFVWWSFSLLIIGFVMSMLFRSPIAAVLAMLPTMVLVLMASAFTTEQILRFGGASQWMLMNRATTGQCVAIIGVHLASLLLMVVILYGLSYRRLCCAPARSNLFKTAFASEQITDFRPTAAVSLAQPSVVKAMTWQQYRQTAWIAVPATLLVVSACLLDSDRGLGSNVFGALSYAVIFLSVSILGSTTFYADAVNRRCAFFADRGIHESVFWISRVSVSTIYFLICMSAVCFWGGNSVIAKIDNWHGLLVSSIAVTWASGLFASLIVKRPVLGFFVGPLIVTAFQMVLFQYYYRHQKEVWTIVFIAPILVFSTLPLMQRWMEGNQNLWFYLQAACCFFAAAVIPVLISMAV